MTEAAVNGRGRRRALAVVMPVYNEQETIAAVARQWLAVVRAVVPDFEMIVLDDGSPDATGAQLDRLAGDPNLTIVHKANEGHGPTILKGYRQAVERADWVFQTDSDDELPAASFPEFWRLREGADLVLGRRTGRQQPIGRRVASAGSRLLVRLLCGRGGLDVNVPYRLIRADLLRDIVASIPDGTFAPNVAIVGLAVRRGARIVERPVPHSSRRVGPDSLAKAGRLLRAVVVSLRQTARILARR
jgi:dolichol-phosphate mannosyltransferase